MKGFFFSEVSHALNFNCQALYSGYLLEMVSVRCVGIMAHYWNGGYTIGMVAILLKRWLTIGMVTILLEWWLYY